VADARRRSGDVHPAVYRGAGRPRNLLCLAGRRADALGSAVLPPCRRTAKRYANGKRIQNALQTNGTLLDDEWGAFLKENDFLVGLSIDGPRELHDVYRVDKKGRPTFDAVYAGLTLLSGTASSSTR